MVSIKLCVDDFIPRKNIKCFYLQQTRRAEDEAEGQITVVKVKLNLSRKRSKLKKLIFTMKLHLILICCSFLFCVRSEDEAERQLTVEVSKYSAFMHLENLEVFYKLKRTFIIFRFLPASGPVRVALWSKSMSHTTNTFRLLSLRRLTGPGAP